MDARALEGYGTPATNWPGSGYASTPGTQWSPQKIASKRGNIVELILQQATLAIQGYLSPGSGFAQLRGWAEDVGERIGGAVAGLAQLLADLWNNPAEVISNLVASMIPGLDATKIESGLISLSRLPGEVLTTITGVAAELISGVLNALNIPGLDATKITSGFIALSRLPGQVLTTITGVAADLISGVLAAINIPGLDATKITSGLIALSRMPSQVLTTITGVAASLINGALAAANIPSLDASKITSGLIALSRLPGQVLTTITGVAADLISGVLNGSLIPSLDASKIATGLIALSRLPSQVLTTITGVAASLISGALAAANIPGLDATKITSGFVNLARLPSITLSKLASDVTDLFAGWGVWFTNLFRRNRDPENIAAGSDFEDLDLIPWEIYTNGFNTKWRTSGIHAHSGAASLKCDTSDVGGDTAYLKERQVEAYPGDQIYVRLWVYKSSGFNGTNSYTKLRFSNQDGVHEGSVGYAIPALPAETWTLVEGSFTVANAATTSVTPHLTNDGTTGVIWLDDIVIQKKRRPESIFDLDAGKIVSGIFGGWLIPQLDVSKILQGATPLPTVLSNLLPWNWFNTKAIAGSNQCIDPGFEDSSISRRQYSGSTTEVTYSTGVKRSGNRSYHFRRATSTAWEGIYLDPSPQNYRHTVKAGDKYRVGVHVRASAGNTGSGYVRLYQRWRSSNSGSYVDTPSLPTVSESSLASDSWTRFEIVGECPSGYDQMEVILLSSNNSDANNGYYLDDAEVREVTESQNIIAQLWGSIGATITGWISGAKIPQLDVSKILQGSTPLPTVLSNLGGDIGGVANDLADGLADIARGLYNGWFGSGGTGAVSQVQYVIETVKDAVINGWNVQVYTSSATWTKPPGTELQVLLMGGGENGATGNPSAPAPGGRNGGCLLEVLDYDSVSSTVAVTIGTAGNPTTFGGYASVQAGQPPAAAGQFIYMPNLSAAGDGGAGGYSGVSGEDGQSSVKAAGGEGRIPRSAGSGAGLNGGDGESVSPAARTKCGGGGGGGGGYMSSPIPSAVTGGQGGAGGYPSGGGGAGGGCNAAGGVSTQGSGGPGAPGLAVVMSR